MGIKYHHRKIILIWSGIGESNPFLHLGKVALSRLTNPALWQACEGDILPVYFTSIKLSYDYKTTR